MNAFQNKRVLITGATGLLGSNLVEHCLSHGCSTVYAMGRNKKRLQETFGSRNNLILIEHDIATPIPSELGQLDYIFHAASPISGAVITSSPVDVINANLQGTINCLEYLKKQKSGRMVVFSSATVYAGSTKDILVATEDCTQHSIPIDSPNAPYAESKRMIEVIANAYTQQYGIEALIARFSYLYGYSPNAAGTAFYEFIFKALRGQSIIMNKRGLPRRDNIYIDDAVDALLCLCNAGAWGGTYNISSCGDGANYAAIDEIAETIAHEANLLNGTDIKVQYVSDAIVPRPEGMKLDNTKLKSFGWCIRTDLREGIKRTLEKYKKRT